MTDSIQDRQFIRHPTDMPIHWHLDDVALPGTEYLRNISAGGLAFLSRTQVPEGATIDIDIPVQKPEVSFQGVVIWCRPGEDGCFEVGVRFTDAGTQFRMRMVEQICHIEQFKKEIQEKEGRTLTGEEAALEWIRRYAKDFPR